MGKGTKIVIYVKVKWISYFVQRKRRRVPQPPLPFVRNGYFFRHRAVSLASSLPRRRFSSQAPPASSPCCKRPCKQRLPHVRFLSRRCRSAWAQAFRSATQNPPDDPEGSSGGYATSMGPPCRPRHIGRSTIPACTSHRQATAPAELPVPRAPITSHGGTPRPARCGRGYATSSGLAISAAPTG